MKKAGLIISVILTFLVSSTCKDEFAVRDFPSVITTAAIIKGTEGVEFSGEIIGRKTGLAETGFIWQNGTDPVEKPGYKMTLPGRLTAGKFNILISTSLKKDVEYYVRAYAKTENTVIYGDVLTFTSPEDFKPGIISVSPLTGLVGDTVNIKGGIFNSDSSKIIVRFNDLRSDIVFSSDSLIRCIVPMNLTSKLSTVSIIDEGPASAFGESFILSTPTVSTVLPETAVFNDTISIAGTGFHKNSQLNIVKIGGAQAAIVTNSPTLIKVRVPYITDSLCLVSVTVSGQTAVSLKKIKITAPAFDFFVPETANYLDTVTIHCRNIRPADIKSVFIDNIQTKIIRSGAYDISVEVPTGLKKELSDLKLNFGSGEYTFNYKFRLTQPVITGLSPEKVYNQQVLTIKGSGFNPLNSGNQVDLFDANNRKYSFVPVNASSSSLEIRILNPEIAGSALPSGRYTLSVKTCETGTLFNTSIQVADSWRKLAAFPGGERYKGVAFAVNGKGYTGMGTKIGNNLQKDLWEFNPSTESWTRMTDFPGLGRILPSVFVNSAFGFVGAGQSIDNTAQQVPYKDFYKYNPLSNSWERIADAPLADKSFLGGNASTSSNRHITSISWGILSRYTEATNSWLQLPSDGASYYLPSTFSLKNKIYFVGGVNNDLTNGTNQQVWEFDTETNTMTRKRDFPGTSRYAAFGFSIGNFGYTGCGINVIYNQANKTTYLNDIYRYNPDDDTWIQIESFPGGYKVGASIFVLNNKAYILFGYNSSVLTSDIWEFYPGL
jgi:N-acetylneuraminic acid mutarotase